MSPPRLSPTPPPIEDLGFFKVAYEDALHGESRHPSPSGGPSPSGEPPSTPDGRRSKRVRVVSPERLAATDPAPPWMSASMSSSGPSPGFLADDGFAIEDFLSLDDDAPGEGPAAVPAVEALPSPAAAGPSDIQAPARAKSRRAKPKPPAELIARLNRLGAGLPTEDAAKALRAWQRSLRTDPDRDKSPLKHVGLQWVAALKADRAPYSEIAQIIKMSENGVEPALARLNATEGVAASVTISVSQVKAMSDQQKIDLLERAGVPVPQTDPPNAKDDLARFRQRMRTKPEDKRNLLDREAVRRNATKVVDAYNSQAVAVELLQVNPTAIPKKTPTARPIQQPGGIAPAPAGNPFSPPAGAPPAR